MIKGLHNVPYFQYRGQFKQQYYITKLMSLRSVTRTLQSTYTILPYYAVKSNTKPKTWGIVIKDITVIIRSLMEHEGKL